MEIVKKQPLSSFLETEDQVDLDLGKSVKNTADPQELITLIWGYLKRSKQDDYKFCGKSGTAAEAFQRR